MGYNERARSPHLERTVEKGKGIDDVSSIFKMGEASFTPLPQTI